MVDSELGTTYRTWVSLVVLFTGEYKSQIAHVILAVGLVRLVLITG